MSLNESRRIKRSRQSARWFLRTRNRHSETPPVRPGQIESRERPKRILDRSVRSNSRSPRPTYQPAKPPGCPVCHAPNRIVCENSAHVYAARRTWQGSSLGIRCLRGRGEDSTSDGEGEGAANALVVSATHRLRVPAK